jgi:hypothetical protein
MVGAKILQMFKKLDFTLDIDFEKIKNDQMIESYGGTFFSYAIKDMEYFNSILKKNVKFNITPFSINYTEISKEGAQPHTDGPLVALNYYLQTNGDATLFWESTTPDIKILPPNQGLDGGPVNENSTVLGYDATKLKLVNYFIAKDNDAYLFDVSKIHSISGKDYNFVRRFIRIFWENVTFDEVLNSIEILPK